MKIRFNRIEWLQYIALYIMLLFNSSNYYNYNIDGKIPVQIGIISIMALLLLFRYNKQSRNTLFVVSFFLFFVLFVRIVSGGIGIGFWSEMAIKILCTGLTIMIDKKNFLDRFVKIVAVFSFISIVFWVPQLFGINLAKMLLHPFVTRNNVTSWDTGSKVVTNLTGYGQLFYSYLGVSGNRNVGIFSEPGVYQMVLNTAIYILVFFENQVFVRDKTKKILFLLFTICLVSTQSTSGYFGYASILLCLFLSRKSAIVDETPKRVNWKNFGIAICVLGIFVLAADFAVRGEASLINVAFFVLLFNDSNQFTLTAEGSTGIYRAASTVMALQAMIKYPYGLGIDKWNAFSMVNQYAGPGGWPFKLGAVIGVVPFIYLMIWLFRPLSLKKNKIAIILFVFLYFNTALAQSSAVYPALIMIPMYLRITRYWNISRNS